jgi:hypothetical protein
VQGSTKPGINGTYAYSNSLNLWQSDAGNNITIEKPSVGVWLFKYTGGQVVYINSDASTNYPPQTGWSAVFIADNPAPNISYGPCPTPTTTNTPSQTPTPTCTPSNS